MLNHIDFYYFSPTGGTKKTGDLLAASLAQTVNAVDLGSKQPVPAPESHLVVAAAPVFGGRIPALAAEKLKALDGKGKQAVTLVVYGTRAYEDALLELNHVMEEAGFQVVASGAFVAQHSVVPEVGPGRPDAQDAAELQAFGQKILDKLSGPVEGKVTVPGSFPYKPEMSMPVTPISLPDCKICKKCVKVCPTDAIRVEEETLVTDADKCILCMACVAACPTKVRILPPPVQENMNKMLGALKDVRRENESYL